MEANQTNAAVVDLTTQINNLSAADKLALSSALAASAGSTISITASQTAPAKEKMSNTTKGLLAGAGVLATAGLGYGIYKVVNR